MAVAVASLEVRSLTHIGCTVTHFVHAEFIRIHSVNGNIGPTGRVSCSIAVALTVVSVASEHPFIRTSGRLHELVRQRQAINPRMGLDGHRQKNDESKAQRRCRTHDRRRNVCCFGGKTKNDPLAAAGVPPGGGVRSCEEANSPRANESTGSTGPSTKKQRERFCIFLYGCVELEWDANPTRHPSTEPGAPSRLFCIPYTLQVLFPSFESRFVILISLKIALHWVEFNLSFGPCEVFIIELFFKWFELSSSVQSLSEVHPDILGSVRDVMMRSVSMTDSKVLMITCRMPKYKGKTIAV